MHKHNLKSSFLESCSYEKETKVLTVVFKNGKEYLFADVPQECYDGFCTAESAGKYFASEVKGKYKAPENE